jgi:hypothetical protein
MTILLKRVAQFIIDVTLAVRKERIKNLRPEKAIYCL